jgi:ketosteroid isomerase-like protein
MCAACFDVRWRQRGRERYGAKAPPTFTASAVSGQDAVQQPNKDALMRTSDSDAKMIAIAKRFIEVASARDIEGMRSLYAPDMVMWHNTDCIELSADDHLTTYKSNTAPLKSIVYSDVRIMPTDDGYVQQHLITADLGEGREMKIACCVVARVKDGKITRLDEYYDSGAFAASGLKVEH